jgi:hypothetical protein
MGGLLYTASFATTAAAEVEANIEKLFAEIVKRTRDYPLRPRSAMPAAAHP